MTDPSKFADDDWAELAREVERAQPASPPPAETKSHDDPAPTTDDFEDGPQDESAESADDLEDASVGSEADASEGATAGDATPGTGRKRRRRRRRKKKGGGQPAGVAVDESDVEKGEDGDAEDTADEAEPAAADVEYSEEVVEEAAEELAFTPDDAEEDSGGEVLRELIANWNVPSWDEVVGSLYRPER